MNLTGYFQYFFFQNITPEMETFLRKLMSVVDVGFIGGSDRPKQLEQLGERRLFLILLVYFLYFFDAVVEDATFSFSENGLVTYRGKELLHKMVNFFFINFIIIISLFRI